MFWGLVIFFFNLFYVVKDEGFLKIEKVLFLSSATFLILALVQYILYPDQPPYLTFGNINLSSEFVGFSLAFQYGFLSRCWKYKAKSWKLNLFASLSITYIYISNCRSVIIGSFLIFLFSVFTNRKMFKENIKILILSGIFVFSLREFIFLLYPDLEIMSFMDKSSSFRWLLYTNTLEMIYQNPLGVGIGQFEFASLPYLGALFPTLNESFLFSTPHNEFLHYLSEDGIIFSFLFFLCAISIVYLKWKEFKEVFTARPDIFYYFIMLFAQALFQFPLLEPLPYFMTALMLGYLCFLLPVERVSYELKLGSRSALIIINFFAILMIWTSFAAKYISFNIPNNEPLNKLACTYGNRNWHACLNVSQSYLIQGEYDKAGIYASQALKWQPLNYQGLKLLGFSYLYKGDRRTACHLFNKFDSLFEKQSSLHKLLIKECTPFFYP